MLGVRDWDDFALALEIGDGEDLGIRTGVDIFSIKRREGVRDGVDESELKRVQKKGV